MNLSSKRKKKNIEENDSKGAIVALFHKNEKFLKKWNKDPALDIYEHFVNRQYVMTSGFVDSWIYLYTTDRQIKW